MRRALVGEPAPDFDLPTTRDPDQSPSRSTLADYRGSWLALIFYPRDFSLVCPTELTAISERIGEFRRNECEGRTLDRMLAEKALSSAQTADIGRQIAAGLAEAHAHGITHGDLKPANVMITDEGVAKILDFGLARRDELIIDPDATAKVDADTDRGLTGTPAYMSPEQARAERAVPASDVFALGLILFEMLTGRKVISGDRLYEVLAQIHTIDADRCAGELNEPFDDIVRAALVRNAAERKITMKDITARLA